MSGITSGGPSGEAVAVSGTSRLQVSIPQYMERPNSSNTRHAIDIYCMDATGYPLAPDADGGTAVPAVYVANDQGTNRSANLCKTSGGTAADASTLFSGYYKATQIAVGHYRIWYKTTSTDDAEALDVRVIFQQTVGGVALNILTAAQTIVFDEDADLTALQADIGDASAATLGSIYGILGNPATTITADIATVQTNVGDASGDTIKSVNAKIGDVSSDLATLIGAPSADISADIAEVLTNVGDASSDTLKSVNAKIGDVANDLATLIGTPATSISADILDANTSIGDPSGDTLTSITAKLGDGATTVTADLAALATAQGDPAAHTLKSTTAKLGDLAVSVATLIGTPATSISADILAANTNLGDASGDTLKSIVAKIGNSASTLVALITAVKRSAGLDQIVEFPITIANDAVVAATVGTVTGGPVFLSAAYAVSTGANAGAVAWTVTENNGSTNLIANTEAVVAALDAVTKPAVVGAASAGVYLPVGTLIQVVGDVGGSGAASTWKLGLNYKACADGAHIA